MRYSSLVTLETLRPGQPATIVAVRGERGFRRRLLELGLLPGVDITVLRIAPLGDPMELSTHGTHLSIRRAEARQIEVTTEGPPQTGGAPLE